MKTLNPPQAVTVDPYIVEVHHVKVTVRIQKSQADYLATQNSLIRATLGDSIHAQSLSAQFELRAGVEKSKIRDARFTAGLFPTLRGMKAAPVTLHFKRSQWEELQKLAGALGVKVEALLRGRIFDRVLSLRAFHDKQSRAASAAHGEKGGRES